MHKVVIYYDCSWEYVARIKERFGITCGTTINGETCQPIEVKDEDWETLLETQRRGYIQIRKDYGDTERDNNEVGAEGTSGESK